MRARVAVILLGLAACDSATPPERPIAYDYGVRVQGGSVLTFRWPESSLPVRIWVQPQSDLRFAVEAAIRAWEKTALYGEFRGVIVPDSLHADVHVRLGAPYTSDPSIPLNCGSSTGIGVWPDSTIILPFPVTLYPRLGVGSSDLADCFVRLATHELGHTLGLFQHSTDPEDLMHARPSSDGLSPRDQATFDQLYHSPTSVRLPPGR